jgi:hypothetical protein
MEKLNVDLELLVQSFAFDDDELGVEYLDKESGEIMNIPRELIKVLNGELTEEDLADWHKDLLPDAYSIKGSEGTRYIQIPNLDDSYLFNVMSDFANREVASEHIKDILIKALDSDNPMRNFKNIIFQNPKEEERWDVYEEKRLEEYAIRWLDSIRV